LGLDGHSKFFENAAQHGRGNINSIRRREFWELSSKRKKRNEPQCNESEKKQQEVRRDCLQNLKAVRECRPLISTWHLMYLWKPEI